MMSIIINLTTIKCNKRKIWSRKLLWSSLVHVKIVCCSVTARKYIDFYIVSNHKYYTHYHNEQHNIRKCNHNYDNMII